MSCPPDADWDDRPDWGDEPGWEEEGGGRDEAAVRPTRPAVEQLIEEVEAETRPQGLLSVGGLRGRVAIVTGGSSGIGRAVAVALARSGVSIGFNWLDTGVEARAEADRVASELSDLGAQVRHRGVDCSNPRGVEAFVDWVAEELGGLHILVNNAGIARDRALWHMSDEEWEDVLATNLTGAFYFIRAVSPRFRRQEFGKIVNVSSVHALKSDFGLANYAASKAGLLGLTRSAALELGPSNVNVNAVAPGYVRTTRLTDGVPSEILDRAREGSALGRLGDPQDVAGCVLFLVSEAARHITGAVLPVDGGHLL